MQRPSVVGAWAIKDRLSATYRPDETDCGTDFAVRYDADGTYAGPEQQGRWYRTGDTLTERVTHELDLTDEWVAVRPRTNRYRIRWLSRNHFNAHGTDGIDGMIRCPPLP